MYSSESRIDELRVPVRRPLVEVFTEREHRTASIFVPPGGSPADVFEDEAPFFPLEEGGLVKLYARRSVVAIVVDDAEAAPESTTLLGVRGHVRNLAVRLKSGRVITGLVTSFGRMRTLDLLNQSAKSIALRVGEKVHYIAKAHVEQIEEVP